MDDSPSMAVLGFRPHTYWTAAVALAGHPDAPRVVARRRIVFAAGLERFVYHQAAELEPAKAHALIAEVRAATQTNATREVVRFIADLRRDGVEVRAAVVPSGTARPSRSLEDLLRTHARIHAAEGDFYRDVVASACAGLALEVHRVGEHDLPGLLSAALRIDGATLEARLRAMGAALVPPWNEDHRLATQAAWIHLATTKP